MKTFFRTFFRKGQSLYLLFFTLSFSGVWYWTQVSIQTFCRFFVAWSALPDLSHPGFILMYVNWGGHEKGSFFCQNRRQHWNSYEKKNLDIAQKRALWSVNCAFLKSIQLCAILSIQQESTEYCSQYGYTSKIAQLIDHLQYIIILWQKLVRLKKLFSKKTILFQW